MRQKILERLSGLVDKMVATAAEAVIVGVGVDSANSSNAIQWDWAVVGGSALAGAILSLCYNLSREGLTGRLNRDVADPNEIDDADWDQ